MKKILLTTLAAASVGAPLATVVACGNKKESWVHPTISNDNTYEKDEFTPETLKERAIGENDNTFWNGGLAYHAISQSISILRGLAHEYGYDTLKDGNGKTAKDKFLEAKGDVQNKVPAELITDADTTIKPTDPNYVRVLRSISYKQENNMQSFGDTRFWLEPTFGEGEHGINADVIAGAYSNYFQYDATKEAQNLPAGQKAVTFVKHNAVDQNDYPHYYSPELNDDLNTLKNSNGDKLLSDDDHTANKDNIDDLIYKSISIHNDPEVPGQLIYQIEAYKPYDFVNEFGDAVTGKNMPQLVALREIKMPGMGQIYPKIDSQWLEQNIVPIVKKSIEKLCALFGNPDLVATLKNTGVKGQTLFDEIYYLRDIFFETYQGADGDGNPAILIKRDADGKLIEKDAFNSQDFVANLEKLNNGSAHWLAFETMYKGINADFTANKVGDKYDTNANDIYPWVMSTKYSGALYWLENGSDLPGLAAMDDSEGFDAGVASAGLLATWMHYSSYTSNVKTYGQAPDVRSAKGEDMSNISRLAPIPANGFDADGLKKDWAEMIKTA